MVVPWGYLGDERTLYRYMWSIREDAKTFGIDNNLQWRFGGDRVEHTVLAGLDYRRLESDYGYGFDFYATGLDASDQIGRASWRERVGQYVEISVVGG